MRERGREKEEREREGERERGGREREKEGERKTKLELTNSVYEEVHKCTIIFYTQKIFLGGPGFGDKGVNL